MYVVTNSILLKSFQAYCGGNGQFAYDLDCHKYVNCWQGGIGAILQTCHPSNLVFNPKTGACTWPSDPDVQNACNHSGPRADLEESAVIFPGQLSYNNGDTLVAENTSSHEDLEKYLCPSDYSGLLPFPYDCKKFVNCWKGITFNSYKYICNSARVLNYYFKYL